MSIPKTGNASPSQYGINDILQYTEPKKPGVFRRVLGSVAGGAANVFAPGIGTIIGNAIGGGISVGGISVPTDGLLGESSQFLQLQQQIQAESRAFEAASAVLKCRHDAAMSAIRNMK